MIEVQRAANNFQTCETQKVLNKRRDTKTNRVVFDLFDFLEELVDFFLAILGNFVRNLIFDVVKDLLLLIEQLNSCFVFLVHIDLDRGVEFFLSKLLFGDLTLKLHTFLMISLNLLNVKFFALINKFSFK